MGEESGTQMTNPDLAQAAPIPAATGKAAGAESGPPRELSSAGESKNTVARQDYYAVLPSSVRPPEAPYRGRRGSGPPAHKRCNSAAVSAGPAPPSTGGQPGLPAGAAPGATPGVAAGASSATQQGSARPSRQSTLQRRGTRSGAVRRVNSSAVQGSSQRHTIGGDRSGGVEFGAAFGAGHQYGCPGDWARGGQAEYRGPSSGYGAGGPQSQYVPRRGSAARGGRSSFNRGGVGVAGGGSHSRGGLAAQYGVATGPIRTVSAVPAAEMVPPPPPPPLVPQLPWTQEYVLEFFLRCRAILLIGFDSAGHRRLARDLAGAGYGPWEAAVASAKEKSGAGGSSGASTASTSSSGSKYVASPRSPAQRRENLPRLFAAHELFCLSKRQKVLDELKLAGYEDYRIGLVILPGDELDFLRARVTQDGLKESVCRQEFERLSKLAVPISVVERQRNSITPDRTLCLNDENEILQLSDFLRTRLRDVLGA